MQRSDWFMVTWCASTLFLTGAFVYFVYWLVG